MSFDIFPYLVPFGRNLGIIPPPVDDDNIRIYWLDYNPHLSAYKVKCEKNQVFLIISCVRGEAAKLVQKLNWRTLIYRK